MNIKFDSKWKYISKAKEQPYPSSICVVVLSRKKPTNCYLEDTQNSIFICIPKIITIPGVTDVDNYLDTLHQIVDGCKLVKCYNLKVNDPVVVWNIISDTPSFRHFKDFDEETGKIRCFGSGLTSWSIDNKNYSSSWDNWRLPTAEELKERGYVTSLS